MGFRKTICRDFLIETFGDKTRLRTERSFTLCATKTGDKSVRRILFLIVFAVVLCASARAQTRKVILDQDGRGPATTDQQSLLMVLQSTEIETLGITIVSGDQWRDEESGAHLAHAGIDGSHEHEGVQCFR
jgi:hypothetical protein